MIDFLHVDKIKNDKLIEAMCVNISWKHDTLFNAALKQLYLTFDRLEFYVTWEI